MRGEFVTRGGSRAGTREDGIVNMPVDTAIGQIRQHQRRFCNQITDNRPVNCLGAPFTLAEQDVMRLLVDRDDQYAA